MIALHSRRTTSHHADNPPAVRRSARSIVQVLREAVRLRQHNNSVTPPEALFWDRNAAFVCALAAVRQGEFGLAERELTNGNGHRAVCDAHCLNLLGVVYEMTRQWALAKHCYTRAARADRHFDAPKRNLQRYYELTTLGRSQIAICFGDEGAELQ